MSDQPTTTTSAPPSVEDQIARILDVSLLMASEYAQAVARESKKVEDFVEFDARFEELSGLLWTLSESLGYPEKGPRG